MMTDDEPGLETVPVQPVPVLQPVLQPVSTKSGAQSWFDVRRLSCQVYKYMLLLCNCRSEFEPLVPRYPKSSAIYDGTSLQQLTSQVDPLLDGGDEDKHRALQLLSQAENKVSFF